MLFSQFSHLLQNIKSVVFVPIKLSTSYILEVYMQISLLVVLAIATFGDCKKSHKAKPEGYLIHKKGDKKGATYLKIKKSHGKSKHNYWTAHEAQPKGEGADYRDIDNDKWIAMEQKWMDKWDAAWNKLYADAENEKLKPKPEAARDPDSQRTWLPLMDALRNKTEADIEVEKMKTETRDYMRHFINPNYRRRVKWVQTTSDTEELFLAHTLTKKVHDTMDNVRKKMDKEKRPLQPTTQAPTWSLAPPTTTGGSEPTATTTWPAPATPWPTVDKKERQFLNNILDKELKILTWKPPPPKKKALHSDYDYGGVREYYDGCWINKR